MSTSRRPVPPQGTCGWGVCCYGVWYAVAANWADASAPVYVLDDRGQWVQTHWRSGDFLHSPLDAFELHLRQAMYRAGADPEDVDLLLIDAEPLPQWIH
jgi:hypothetical protein